MRRAASTRRHAARASSFELPDWAGHLAGQHVDVRLTAEDGYQAQRSYSIASAPEDEQLDADGRAARRRRGIAVPVDELILGDELELRGPIGGYFVWEESLGGPLLLVAGGSGIVPLRAMLAPLGSRRTSTCGVGCCHSARSLDEVIYREELSRPGGGRGFDVELALTRSWPEDWQGHRGRIDRQLLDERLLAAERSAGLRAAVRPRSSRPSRRPLSRPATSRARIKTERFGATGA